MVKMSKAKARKRLHEAVEKISKVQRAGLITPKQWVHLTERILPIIKKME